RWPSSWPTSRSSAACWAADPRRGVWRIVAPRCSIGVMDDARLIKVSKYLSKHLRHEPERLGLTLAPGGWVRVDELLAACARQRFPIARDELDEVVARNDKQRFSLDPTGTLIRANQGHSVEVDLQLEPVEPPGVLYHGTGHRTAEA